MMGRKAILAAGMALGLFGATGAQAGEMKIYPYATNVNYCPAGLQPVVLNGVICCGQPTTHMSYQQVMRHPVQPRKWTVRYSAQADCAEGTKGCS
ncbi:hypothetical protein [Roseovarius sp. E0-M6]|uniref:hypothetical protein n=1 Tax=Roseovarius sp. E0-M6 TaxID=3127118 RepID=UPI003010588A